MLLSPGHSPRHISVSPDSATATPSSSAAEKTLTLATPNSTAAAQNARKRRATVLDEDTYVASIEKIIERDFFPDIPKLRDRLDWLEAARSGDPIIIRDAQLKILERRAAAAAGKTPSTVATATDGRTRSPFSFATPFGSDKTQSFVPAASDQAANEEHPSSIVDTSLSLDDFCRRYTSEDNESFSKIMEKVNRKRREQYAQLLQGEMEETVKTIEEERRRGGIGLRMVMELQDSRCPRLMGGSTRRRIS